MKKVKVERVIDEALNLDKPDKNVLARARLEMSQKRCAASMWKYYAAAACSLGLIIFSIIMFVLKEYKISYENNSLENGTEGLSAAQWNIISSVCLGLELIIGILTAIILLKKRKNK